MDWDGEDKVAHLMKENNDGDYLQHASIRLRDNEKIVTLALMINPYALIYASSRLKEAIAWRIAPC